MPSEPTAKVVDLPVERRGRSTDGKSAPSDVIIDIRNLGLTFQTADAPVVALSNISLGIRAGEFVSLIGPSGCGKTTLMRIVADLEQPTEGSVTVNGVSPREARLKRSYGYIFQAAALYPWRNVQRNVELPHEVMGVPKEER
ncbi:MAG TPA: ATP-binding cassette domain-containing protein, partial [Dongiaceae bacterium]